MVKSSKIPLMLLGILLLSLWLGEFVPLDIKQILYAISLTIQTILKAALPFIIFTFLFSSIGSFEKNAVFFLIFVMAAVCLSNFAYTQIAYLFSSMEFLPKVKQISEAEHCLEPYWKITLPRLIPNNYALFAGIIFGLLATFMPNRKTWQKASTRLVNISLFFLNRMFIPIIPLFILGFALKLQHDGILMPIFQDYGYVLLTALVPSLTYLGIMYLLVNNFRLAAFWQSLKNMLPAMITGFTTMSGAASIPATLEASEKNTKDPMVVRSVIPMTANIHLLGDGFFIPTVALAIMTSFNFAFPDMSVYLVFSLSFVLAKFAVAGVPAGGIIAMLPVLETTLGFNESMLSLIFSIYVIFDCITTSINVCGNGGFVMAIAKIYRRTRNV